MSRHTELVERQLNKSLYPELHGVSIYRPKFGDTAFFQTLLVEFKLSANLRRIFIDIGFSDTKNKQQSAAVVYQVETYASKFNPADGLVLYTRRPSMNSTAVDILVPLVGSTEEVENYSTLHNAYSIMNHTFNGTSIRMLTGLARYKSSDPNLTRLWYRVYTASLGNDNIESNLLMKKLLSEIGVHCIQNT